MNIYIRRNFEKIFIYEHKKSNSYLYNQLFKVFLIVLFMHLCFVFWDNIWIWEIDQGKRLVQDSNNWPMGDQTLSKGPIKEPDIVTDKCKLLWKLPEAKLSRVLRRNWTQSSQQQDWSATNLISCYYLDISFFNKKFWAMPFCPEKLLFIWKWLNPAVV